HQHTCEIAALDDVGSVLGFQKLDALEDHDLGHQLEAVPHKVGRQLKGGFATIARAPSGAFVRSRKSTPSVVMSVHTTRLPWARSTIAIALVSGPQASQQTSGTGSARTS